MTLDLESSKGVGLNSVFQVCNTSRPLWSVGKICDNGHTVTFDAKGASVRHGTTNKEICYVPRQNGLYIGKLELKKPAGGFIRQG